MSGARKKNVVSGWRARSVRRSAATYSAVGGASGFSAISTWPSAGEIWAPSLSDRLMPEYGVPMTSSMVSISERGMTVRIVLWIDAIFFSASSSRVPGA